MGLFLTAPRAVTLSNSLLAVVKLYRDSKKAFLA